MKKRDIWLYSISISVGAVALWFVMLQPAARDCANRGGHYYAWEGECGKFVFVLVPPRS